MEHEIDGTYFAQRAVPRGKQRFFFTYRGYGQISGDYKVEALEEAVEEEFRFFEGFVKVVKAVVVNFVEENGGQLTS